MSIVGDEIQQKAEWRGRLIADVLRNTHDDEIRVELLEAGLNQAHSEGVEDAAVICETIANGSKDPAVKRVASVLAKALRDYDARNKATRDTGQSTTRTEG